MKKYNKMDPLQHILHRSDTYVGSTRPRKQKTYISQYLNNFKIVEKEINYAPAILRIFIEALSNAIDNVARSINKIPCKTIKINIDIDSGLTQVWNDGESIPIEFDKDEQCYIHSLIFGQLLTSSNYDDTEDRYDISGRNGIGIKATSVFSTEFKVEGVDPNRHLMLQQEWKQNMTITSQPVIKKVSKSKKGYTFVSWIPDFKRFGLKSYTKDIVELYCKYVVDCAMIVSKHKVQVYFNDEKISIPNIEKYAQLYFEEPLEEKILIKKNDDRILVVPLKKQMQKQKHISFVNGVLTKDGGTHVDGWSKQIFKPIADKLSKSKSCQITSSELKKYFMLFVNVCIAKPEFESQSKNHLESKIETDKLKPKELQKIMKWDIIELIKQLKELTQLKKLERSKTKKFIKVEGFDPANNEGTQYSKDCTLILVEGLSAKTFAVQGIQSGVFDKKGRDWFGIYPLRGKLLNVRNAKTTSITKNNVINDIITILGIRSNVDYRDDKNFETLRYGRVMMLCDADCDGIHITGLIQNMFHYLYPTLLKRKQPFLTSMQTPIVKVFLPNKTELIFYDETKYKEYEEKNMNIRNKYYKGLGSSSQKDIKESFGVKMLEFTLDNDIDLNMNKVFSKHYSDKRKQWLIETQKDSVIEWTKSSKEKEMKKVNLSDYLNTEVKKFSINDCERSIPHVMDGLKESQRKVLYACFLKNLKHTGKTLKVAQLAGFVAEKTAYHHGEQNLYDTITRMANNYIGSNNIPYLYRDGQFGTRISNGKDAANARYIFTKLDKLTRFLFRNEDDDLLSHRYDDNDKIEPYYYVPIIPTILVNGCSSGIGTGWSSNVPCYNPIELIDCVICWIHNKPYPKICPWYNQFKGTIEKISETKYKSSGIIEKHKKKKNVKIIKELPVGLWTDDFKDYLYNMMEKKLIKNVKNYSTPTEVDIHITEDKYGKTCNLNTLRMSRYIHTSNMVLFTEKGIQKFNTIYEILDYFCKKRYELYITRKTKQLEMLGKEITILENKFRFLTEIMNETFHLFKKTSKGRVSRTIQSIEDEFKKKNYNLKYGYDYMIKMQFRTITHKSMIELEQLIKQKKVKYQITKNTSEKQMWLYDLEDLKNRI